MDFSHVVDIPAIDAEAKYCLVQLDDRGRLVLPRVIRSKLHLRPKEKFVAVVEDGVLHLAPISAQVAKTQGILAHLSPERSLSKELIEERRKEAELE
jgi:bifunctional DNA-binding transcriptional regulator/antitoxin component of YhaV-PrlF toxin-antitoxin module